MNQYKLWHYIEQNTSTKASLVNILAFIITVALHLFLYGLSNIYNFYKIKQVKDLKKPLQIRFVEPNLSLFIQEPLKTNHIAIQSQKAAQPQKTDKMGSSIPNLKGEYTNSQSIVEKQSNLDTQTDTYTATVSTINPIANNNYSQELEKQPLPISPFGAKASIEKNQIKENKVVIAPSSYNTDIKRPKPLPRISTNKPIQAPIMKSNTQVTAIGKIAIDSKITPFGIYQQKMLEAISTQWVLLSKHSKNIKQDLFSELVIEFTLTCEGDALNVNIISSTASKYAQILCQDAIRSRSPFGPWPEEMLSMLGKQTSIRIHFLYH